MWLAFLAVVLSPSFVQTQAPAAGSSAEASVIHVPDGASLMLLLKRTPSTRTAKAGDPVAFRVMEDVKQEGLVVIAAGAPATGSVTRSQPPGRGWKEGHLELRPGAVQLVSGAWAKLSAQPVEARGRSLSFKRDAAGKVTEAAFIQPGSTVVLRRQ